MAYTYDEKKKLQSAWESLKAKATDEEQYMLECVRSVFDHTDAEKFAYETVLPELSTDHYMTAAQMLAALGLGDASKRSVSSALVRLVKDGRAKSVKNDSGTTEYVKVA